MLDSKTDLVWLVNSVAMSETLTTEQNKQMYSQLYVDKHWVENRLIYKNYLILI